MNSHEVFIHIHQGCFAGTGAIVRLPQCQWSKPDGYGKISQCRTTTKHSKAVTVCIFLGIYCIYKSCQDIFPLFCKFLISCLNEVSQRNCFTLYCVIYHKYGPRMWLKEIFDLQWLGHVTSIDLVSIFAQFGCHLNLTYVLIILPSLLLIIHMFSSMFEGVHWLIKAIWCIYLSVN